MFKPPDGTEHAASLPTATIRTDRALHGQFEQAWQPQEHKTLHRESTFLVLLKIQGLSASLLGQRREERSTLPLGRMPGVCWPAGRDPTRGHVVLGRAAPAHGRRRWAIGSSLNKARWRCSAKLPQVQCSHSSWKLVLWERWKENTADNTAFSKQALWHTDSLTNQALRSGKRSG